MGNLTSSEDMLVSNTKQPAITLGTHVCFYVTGTRDLLFRKQFRMRPSYRFALGPYLATVADIDIHGTTVALQVLDASGLAHARSGVRVLAQGDRIPEFAEHDVCTADMTNMRILHTPDDVWMRSEVTA